MSGDSVAQDQIKAFVERILRMKEERKAIDADIREIYAEAKGSGFDKTVLGKLVNYVEKRAVDANAVMESESLFDLYLSAYDSASGRVGTVRATHTHESKSEPQPSPKAGQAREDAASSIGDAGSQLVHSSVENEAAEISTPITEQQEDSDPARDLTASPKLPQGQVAPIQPELEGALSEVALPTTDEDTGLSGQGSASGTRSAGGDGSSPSQAPVKATGKPVEASASAAPLSFADKIKRLRPNCQHPEACRSSGGKAHCGPCGRAAETGSAA